MLSCSQFLSGHTLESPPNYVDCSIHYGYHIWARCPVPFEHVSVWYPFLDPHLIIHHSNIVKVSLLDEWPNKASLPCECHDPLAPKAGMLPRSFAERLRRCQCPPSYVSEIHLSLDQEWYHHDYYSHGMQEKKGKKNPSNFHTRIKDPWVSRSVVLASKQAITSQAIREYGPVRPSNVVVRRSTWSRRRRSTQPQGAALLNPGCITSWYCWLVQIETKIHVADSCRHVACCRRVYNEQEKLLHHYENNPPAAGAGPPDVHSHRNAVVLHWTASAKRNLVKSTFSAILDIPRSRSSSIRDRNSAMGVDSDMSSST